MTLDDWWATWDRPYRHAVVDAIDTLGPAVRTVLEGGCHCGPNLRLLAMRRPELTLAGFDREPRRIAYARGQLPQSMLWETDWRTTTFLGGQVDVILSVYSLAYVSPGALAGVLQRALTAAQVALVLAEPMAPAPPMPGEWVHDYGGTLTALGVGDRVERRPFPTPSGERLNGLVLVHTGGAFTC